MAFRPALIAAASAAREARLASQLFRNSSHVQALYEAPASCAECRIVRKPNILQATNGESGIQCKSVSLGCHRIIHLSDEG
jgi:hypothetical protein